MKSIKNIRFLLPVFFLLMILPLLLVAIEKNQQYLSKAIGRKAEIYIDTSKTLGPMPQTWKALAQGGEEKGVRMLSNVIGQITELGPRYIRIDHIYDFYAVAQRDINGNLILNWENLDETVCDILRTGARPFFSLGYMPPALSKNGSLISTPGDWNDWTFLVQKTIEHYSGADAKICNSSLDQNLNNIYYEVWNEPDLETFGKWSIYGGEKDYKTLYYYSSLGAQNAAFVKPFFLGGPATTSLYANWIKYFLDYIKAFNLRLDFISWHHYSQNPDDFDKDLKAINTYLSSENYQQFSTLPLIISEWGFDSGDNSISETETAAAHAVSAIRNLIEQKLEMAFIFDIKDGPLPRWGILTNDGKEKMRFKAIKLLGKLGKIRLLTSGEGTYVKAIASRQFQTTTVILVNFDIENVNSELVPVTFLNLEPGKYYLTQTDLSGKSHTSEEQTAGDGILIKKIYLSANNVLALELTKIQL